MAGRIFSALRTAVVAASCALVLGIGSAHAETGEPIGDAVTIVNTVSADFDKQQRKLAVGDGVRQDEVIEVNIDAQGEFKLKDETKLALGPGSRLVLDKFVYDSDKKAGSIVLEMAKGAFRFITGVATKPTYVIRTPNASITVRGTIFDLFIFPDQTVWLLLHQGAIEVTAARNVCRVLDQPGQLMRVTSNGSVGIPVNWKELPGHDAVPFDTAFPFVAKAPQIDPVPVMTRDVIVDGAFPDAPTKTCANAVPPVKIQKADDDGGQKKKRKAAASDDDDNSVTVKSPRKRTAKRSRDDDDDDYGNGARAIDIIKGGIGIGIGGGRGGGGGDGGKGHDGYGR